jgi:hypothetical protein
MYFRQLLNEETACASYLFGCNTAGELAVVDPHADLVADYIAAAQAQAPASPPCWRRTCRQTMSLDFRSSSSAPVQPRTCQPVRVWNSSTTRSPMASW